MQPTRERKKIFGKSWGRGSGEIPKFCERSVRRDKKRGGEESEAEKEGVGEAEKDAMMPKTGQKAGGIFILSFIFIILIFKIILFMIFPPGPFLRVHSMKRCSGRGKGRSVALLTRSVGP